MMKALVFISRGNDWFLSTKRNRSRLSCRTLLWLESRWSTKTRMNEREPHEYVRSEKRRRTHGPITDCIGADRVAPRAGVLSPQQQAPCQRARLQLACSHFSRAAVVLVRLSNSMTRIGSKWGFFQLWAIDKKPSPCCSSAVQSPPVRSLLR